MTKIISFRVNDEEYKQLVNMANGIPIGVYIRKQLVNAPESSSIQQVNACKQRLTVFTRIRQKLLGIFRKQQKTIDYDRLHEIAIENNRIQQINTVIDKIVQIIRKHELYTCTECGHGYKRFVDECLDCQNRYGEDGEDCIFGDFSVDEMIEEIEALKGRNSKGKGIRKRLNELI